MLTLLALLLGCDARKSDPQIVEISKEERREQERLNDCENNIIERD